MSATLPAGNPDGGLHVVEPIATPTQQELLRRLIVGRESFWTVIHAPFMQRDLLRDDVRCIVRVGLQRTLGNYKLVAALFNVAPGDYKRMLNFLHKNGCWIPYQPYRRVDGVRASEKANMS